MARGDGDDGLQCLQDEDKSAETKGVSMLQKKDDSKNRVKYISKGEKDCYHWGQDDHWAPDCPQLNKEQQVQLHIQDWAIASQVNERGTVAKTGGVRCNYLYIDTCSMNDFMVNPAYLTAVHTVDDPLCTTPMAVHNKGIFIPGM